MPGRRPENCFDFIRLLAAISVVLAHGIRHFDAPFLGIPAGTNLFHEGVEGVRIFFILSGMLVFRSALRCFEKGQPLRSFFANRFLRVGPAIYAYALASVVLLLALGVIGAESLVSKTHLAWLAGNLFLVPLYFPPEHRAFGVGVLNGSLWTIPVEVSFYAIVPALAYLKHRGRVRLMGWLLAGAVVAGIALQFGLYSTNPTYFSGSSEPPIWFKLFIVSLVPWLPWFAMGIVMHEVWERLPQSTGWFVAALASYVVLSYLLPLHRAERMEALHLIYAPSLAYVTLWVGTHAFKRMRDLSRLGDLSYGVYVWHMVVINTMLFLGMKASMPSQAPVPLALAITLIVAWLSWRFVEQPSLRLKPYSSR